MGRLVEIVGDNFIPGPSFFPFQARGVFFFFTDLLSMIGEKRGQGRANVPGVIS